MTEPLNHFRNDPPCACHIPPMALTLCGFSNAVDRAYEKYCARKAAEAAAKVGV